MNRRRLVMALLAAVPAALAGAAPAHAHEGEGMLTVEASRPADQLRVAYVVRLTWANDGHPALGSTVTATPVGADGTTVTPVPLAPLDQDGRYGAEVAFPTAGQWTVRFTAISPTGTVERPEALTATSPVPTTTGGPTVTAPTGTSTASAPGAASAPGVTGATSAARAAADATAPAPTPASDDGGTGTAWLVGAAVLLAALGGGAWLLLRRRA